MAKPKIGVIVLNWNGEQDTLECLETVKQSLSTSVSIHIYLVDNASQKDPETTIKIHFPQITLIKNKKNLGFAGGNNIGIKQALEDNCSHICLLNNDTTVHPTTFVNLYLQATNNRFNISSPKIYFYPGREFHHKSYQQSERGKIIWYASGHIDWNNVIPSHIGVDEFDHGQFNQPTETDFATGCCMLIEKKVIEKIGLLNTSTQAYFEDTDYCIRAKKAGFKIGYCPKSHMWHKNAGSTGGSGSEEQTKLVDKSRLYFGLKYAPLRAKLALTRRYFFH